jgi:hypothetical protein
MGVRRSGLSDAAGGLLALGSVMESGRNFLSDHGLSPTLIIPIMMAAGYGMQSRPMLNAMSGTGGSTPLVDALYTNYPYAAAAQNIDNPDQAVRQPPQARPPSPLDQVTNPFTPKASDLPTTPTPNPFTPPNMNPPATYNF